jgi:hypothetical protein
MGKLARADQGAVQGDPMPATAETSALDAASRRLILALDALEAALERRGEADRGEAGLVAQVHALGSDRSRLASDLDAAVARSRSLETTNREIARRLDVAITSIRSVLDANEH